MAKYSPSSTQKSRLNRRLRSAACFSRSASERLVVPHGAGETSAAHLGVVRVALEFARRTREARKRAVAVGDRVPGVLPALVLEAGLLVPALVRDVSVALEVRVLVDPVERSARLVFEVADKSRVAGPSFVLVEQHDVQRRRVGAAVVRASAVVPRTPSSRRSASRAGSGRDPRRESRRRGFPGVRRAHAAWSAASSGANGSACRLVRMLSRPNMVMNQGSPAAGSE